MKIQVNYKEKHYNLSFLVEGDTVKEIREEVEYQTKRRRLENVKHTFKYVYPDRKY